MPIKDHQDDSKLSKKYFFMNKYEAKIIGKIAVKWIQSAVTVRIFGPKMVFIKAIESAIPKDLFHIANPRTCSVTIASNMIKHESTIWS